MVERKQESLSDEKEQPAALGAEKLLYKAAEVGQAIGVSRACAYALIAKGLIPSIRIGSSVRVPVDALREWINSQTRPAGAQRPAA